jgi:ABC-type cobalamin/Fe3+-siderophores transport system ATPase subunit
VTHNPELAARYAERTVELVDGRIVGSHAPELEVAG